MFNTDKKLVIESFIQLTLLLKLFVLERFNQCLEWLSEFTMMFIISYLFIVIGDSRLLPFKKLSFPPPLWLSYTFSSFYFKHKTSRGEWHLRWNSYKCKEHNNETVYKAFCCVSG